MQNKKTPRPDDITIGNNIRARRVAVGMSQEMLGNAIGVTFQQVQKYEKGTNRVGGSRLVQIAMALGVQPAKLLPESNAPAGTPVTASVTAMKLASKIDSLPTAHRKAVTALIDVLNDNTARTDAA